MFFSLECKLLYNLELPEKEEILYSLFSTRSVEDMKLELGQEKGEEIIFSSKMCNC